MVKNHAELIIRGNMHLRWMVRKDEMNVDSATWKSISPSIDVVEFTISYSKEEDKIDLWKII